MIVVHFDCTIGILALTFGKWFKIYFSCCLIRLIIFFFPTSLSSCRTFRFLPPSSKSSPLILFSLSFLYSLLFLFFLPYPTWNLLVIYNLLNHPLLHFEYFWGLPQSLQSYINRLFHLVKVVWWRDYQSFLGYFVYMFIGSIWRKGVVELTCGIVMRKGCWRRVSKR